MDAGRVWDAVARTAVVVRRAVLVTVGTTFVVALALSAFDAEYGVPPTASTCLADCEASPDPVPAAAELVAAQEALGRTCVPGPGTVEVAVLQTHDGAAWIGSAADARAAAGSPDVEVLAYCG